MLEALVPLLGCGLMMLIPMALMARGGVRNKKNDPTTPTPTDAETAALRDEIARLRRLEVQQHNLAQDAKP